MAARDAKMPIDAIYPTDSMKFISSLHIESFDFNSIIVALEDTLKIRIPSKVEGKIPFPIDETPFSDATRNMIECDAIQTLMREQVK